MIWVMNGSSAGSPESCESSSKMPVKTGTMKATTTDITITANPNTSIGYIIAERT